MSEDFLYTSNCPNIVLVGESRVGKSCLLARSVETFPVFQEGGFFTKAFQEKSSADYLPTSLSSYFMNVKAKSSCLGCYCVRVLDTGGRAEFDYLRPLAYMNADVFVYCFDMARLDTLQEYRKKWLPELTRYKSTTPVLLAGIDQDHESDISLVLAMAKNVGGDRSQLRTCCVKTGTGVSDVIEAALQLALSCRDGSKPGARRRSFRRKGDKPRPAPRKFTVPPVEGHPTIEIAPSTYGSDLGQLITDTAYADARFLFQDGHPPLHAHKIVLCSSSCVFRTLFMAAKDNAGVEVSEMFEDISCQCLPPRNSKKILQKHICTTKSVITVNYSVSGELFSYLVEALYTGSPKIPKTKDTKFFCAISELASKFRVSFLLQVIISSCKDTEETPKKKIVQKQQFIDKVNIETGHTVKELFLNKQTFSDLKFVVEDGEVYAHKAILRSRSKVMAALLSGAFCEKDRDKIELPGVSKDSFTALLEYLYSDQFSAEESDPHEVLILADRFCQQRLLQLCESHISRTLSCLLWKHNEELLTETVETLRVSQVYNAGQLARWCLQFIAFNYSLYRDKPAYENITGDDRALVEAHRWPTKDDMEALQQYERLLFGAQEHTIHEKKEAGYGRACCTIF